MSLTSTEPSTTLDAQIEAERQHLQESRAALRRMLDRAQQLFAAGELVAGDRFGAESLGVALARRVKALADDPNTPLFFGRLTFGADAEAGGPGDAGVGGLGPTARDGGPGDDVTGHSGASYHIGRRHVTDDAGEPMVLDWRAPVSRAFYQASTAQPQGVAVRRRFGFSGGTLTGFEDERLDRSEPAPHESAVSRILLEEIERPRVGPMRDIVATIQPDQDVLVRAELEETVCVQGAPGTGKTAVGLHRAAYLLYAHRERLRKSGVLVVGPNQAFLRYISAVLPALGEVEVSQSTVDELIARGTVRLRGRDDPARAALKHDARMAVVLARALQATIRRPTEELVVSDGAWRWRVAVEVLRRIVDDVRRESPPHAIGRDRVRARTVALLQRQAEARRGESPPESWLRKMGRDPAVRAFLDHAWPEVTAEGLVFSLLNDPVTLATAADGLLTDDEQAALLWQRPPRTVKSALWSDADAVLIDEAAGLIDRTASFGHIVLDEAQDLSPMQCRAIARRCEHGSLTVLGDLAQGTAPWAAVDWHVTLAHLGKPDARVVPLTLGFRVPAAVVDLANRLLPSLGVAVPEAVSLRQDGSLDIRQVSDVAAATVAELRAALEFDGSIAVICADSGVAPLSNALRGAGLPFAAPTPADSPTPPDGATPDESDEDSRITLLPASLAKGLEYDHVIVVEPEDIVLAETRGLNRLYVVLTRAVSRLTIVHTKALPLP
jgi:DNA helicase IV